MSLLNNTSALTFISIIGMGTGVVRTKLAALILGRDAVALISQLTQLYVVIAIFATIGLSTGIRVVLARSPDTEATLALTRRLVIGPTILALGVVAVIQPFDAALARQFTGASGNALLVGIAVFSAVPLVALQTMSAAVQARREYARLATSTALGGVFGSVLITAAVLSRSLSLTVLTIAAVPTVQLACVCLIARTPRLLLSAQRSGEGMQAGLRAALHIGIFSFILGGADTLGDTLVRGRLAGVGGIQLVADLQPTYLASAQLFELVLGAAASALMVEVSRDWANLHHIDTIVYNHITQSAVLGAAAVAFLGQAFIGLASVVFYSHAFLPGASTARFALAAEAVNALAWVFGAALLPLGQRWAWLMAGIATVVVMTATAFVLLPKIGATAIVASYFSAWTASAVCTGLGLRRTSLRISRRTWLYAVAATAGLIAAAAISERNATALFSPWPLLIGVPTLGLLYLWQRLSTRSVAMGAGQHVAK